MGRRASIRSLGESCSRRKGAASYSWRLLELRAGASSGYRAVSRRRWAGAAGGKQRAAWACCQLPRARCQRWRARRVDAASQELCCLADGEYKDGGVVYAVQAAHQSIRARRGDYSCSVQASSPSPEVECTLGIRLFSTASPPAQNLCPAVLPVRPLFPSTPRQRHPSPDLHPAVRHLLPSAYAAPLRI